MSTSDPASNPASTTRTLTCEAYPGYEWVATLSGNDWESIGYLGRLLVDHGLDGYCPGTSAFAGFLARIEHATEARRLIASDSWLRFRYGFLEDEAGSHPFHELYREG